MPGTLLTPVAPFDRPFAGGERRLEVRHSCTLRACCKPIEGSSDILWHGRILDFSAHGIGLALERRFEPDTPLVVILPTTQGGESRRLLVRVIHAGRANTGGWFLGCEFLYPLDGDDVEILLDKS